MKLTSLTPLLAIVLGLLGAASAQFGACFQGVEDPDPGDTNYGDLICPFEFEDASLISRTIVFNENSNATGFSTNMDLKGYAVNNVWYLNFGRERGVVTTIAFLYNAQADSSQVIAEVEFDEGTDVRMFFEIYGNVVSLTEGAPNSIKIDTKPKFTRRIPEN